MNYTQVKSKDLKKHGKLQKNGDLHLTEGVYTTFNPLLDNRLTEKWRKEVKETNELINS